MTTDSQTDDAPVAPTFESMPLSDEVRQSLREMGYETPTPVQHAVWESAAAGKDIVVQARTGTGKTTAFGLPLVDQIVRRNKHEPQALVLCPTRELANQVCREVESLGKHKEVTATAIYGGASMERQIDAINAGVQIICGTPGRVLDHLKRGNLDPSTIRALVLDESDEMLSMGFERELTAILERLPDDMQTLLFSATVPPDIERMAKTRLKDPEFIILSGDHVGALEIVHFVYWVSTPKIGALTQIIDIEDPESAIVFCNTKVETENVAKALKREGYEAAWLNGDLAQSEREKVMSAVRDSRVRFLVATDVAARGIDISHLTHVINYDFPQDAETYVHRTGRTGRAGNTGTAISIVQPHEVGRVYMVRLIYKIRPVERQLPTEQDARTRAQTDVVASLAETFSPQADTSHRELARRLLSHDQAVDIVAGILRSHLDTNPELPDVAQSRRRGKTPDPVEEDEPKRKSGKKSKDEKDKRDPREKKDKRDPREKKEKRDPREKKEKRDSSDEGERKSDRKSKSRRGEDDEAPITEQAVRVEEIVEEVVVVEDEMAVDDAPDEQEPRRARRTRQSTSTRRDERKRDDGDRGKDDDRARRGREDRSDRGKDEDDDEDDRDDRDDDRDTKELYVDGGRKHGVRVRLLKSILADGGISPERVHRVRIRERYSFVEVDADVADESIEVLCGAEVEDRQLSANLSQRSR